MWKMLGLSIPYNENRIFGLDLLRAFAILTVVLSHSVTYLPSSVAEMMNHAFLDGVSIFFVLSGFLIGQIVIREFSRPNLSVTDVYNFWIRRWFRTLPLYFLILSVIILWTNLNNPSAPTYKRFYFFSQNLYSRHPGFFIEAWSLSVEEWFYLILPTLVIATIAVTKGNAKSATITTAIILIVFATCVRVLRFIKAGDTNHFAFEMDIRMQVITRLDSLAFGITGACMSFHKKVWNYKCVRLFILGIAILVANKVISNFENHDNHSMYYYIFWLSTNSIGTLSLLPYLSKLNWNKGRFTKCVTYVSLISYSMYLINLTLIQLYIIPYINEHLLSGYIPTNSIKYIDLVLFFGLTTIGSIYLYKYFERPLTQVREKFVLT